MLNDFIEIDSFFNELKMRCLLVNAITNISKCLRLSESENGRLFVPDNKTLDIQKQLLKEQCELIISLFDIGHSDNYFARIAALIATSLENNEFSHWFNDCISLYDDNYTSEPIRVIYHQPYCFNVRKVDEKNRFFYRPETLILANYMRHKTIPQKSFVLTHTISFKMRYPLQIRGRTVENSSYAAVSIDDKSLPLSEINSAFLLI